MTTSSIQETRLSRHSLMFFSSLNVSTMAVKGIFSLMPQSSIIFGESGKGLRKFLGKGLNRFAK